MNSYQLDWCRAKAKVEAAQLFQKQALQDRNDLGYKRHGEYLLEGLKDLELATARLLTFAKEYMKSKYKDRWSKDIEKLYSDPICNYMHVDTLPDTWQSKLIDSTLRTDFSN